MFADKTSAARLSTTWAETHVYGLPPVAGISDVVGATATASALPQGPTRLQVLDKPVCSDPRHGLVGVVDARAAAVAQRKEQCVNQLVDVVARRVSGGLSMAIMLTGRPNPIKNMR